MPGGCGYLGAILVPWLLARGHIVTVYDSMLFGRGGLPEDNEHLTIIKGDVRNVGQLTFACEKQDAVIYLASISAEAMCQRDPHTAARVNVDAVAWAAEVAAVIGVPRFIYASSVAAYAPSENGSCEEDEMQPTTLYGHGKAEAEVAVRTYFPSATIVRCASVCGESARMRFDVTANMMIHDAIKKGVITVNGGEQKRSHIHIYDACDFYALLLDLPLERIAGQTYNLVAVNESVLETAQRIAEITGARIEVRPRSDTRSYTVDGTKARELGFKPKRTIEDAVRRIQAQFDLGTCWQDTMTNPKYMNLL